MYVSIVMTGVETVLSLCEVEVFSSTSMAVSGCSQRLPPDQVAAFRDTCYHFVPGEVAGYDNAAAKCTEYDPAYHLLAGFDPHAKSYLTSRLDAAAAAVDVGVTTDELDRIVHEETVDRDCYPSPLNYYEVHRQLGRKNELESP